MTQDEMIAQDVEQLRTQFSKTTELYREVCGLLFFRYGLQPTANKLYQLVRKGTMSKPATVLNEFWKDLRDKCRYQIDHPGLPENLGVIAGELISALWKEALVTSEANYKIMYNELHNEIEAKMLELINANENILKLTENRVRLDSELIHTQKLLSETENKLRVNIEISNEQEKSLEALQNKNSGLEAQLTEVQVNFSSQVDKLHTSLAISDKRYRSLESKTLMELDRERQRVISLEKELIMLHQSLKKERMFNNAQSIKHQRLVDRLKDNIGSIKGQLKESQRQNAIALKRLDQSKK